MNKSYTVSSPREVENNHRYLSASSTFLKVGFSNILFYSLLSIVFFFCLGFSAEVHGQTTIFSEDFEGSTDIETETVSAGIYQSTSNSACAVSNRWEVLTASSSTSNYNCGTCAGSAASINDAFSSACNDTYEDYTLHMGTFSTAQTELVVMFDWGMHDSDSDPFASLIIQLWNVTDNAQEGADLVNVNSFGSIASLTGAYNQTLTVSPGDDYEIRVTWDTENLYFSGMDNYAQVDNFVVQETCDVPTATYNVVPDCPNGQFSIDVNITNLGSANTVDITNNAVPTVAASNNVGTGVTNIGPFTAGDNIIVTVDGTDDGGCIADASDSQTEACACITVPTLTVTSNAPDCGTATFDIDIDVTSFGSGTTANTGANIYLDGGLNSSNVGLGITTITVPVGVHNIYIEGVGGTGFVTCVSITEMASASCNNDECAEAFPVATDGTLTTSLNTNTYTDSGNDLSCDGGSSDEDAYYSFVAPSSGAVLINVDNSGLSGTNTQYVEGALYASCADVTSNTEISCFPWSDPLNDGQLVTGLMAGNTYYLEVENYNNDWSGTYDVTVLDFAPALTMGVQDCGDFSMNTFDYTDTNTGASCEPCSSSDPDWWVAGNVDMVWTYTPAVSGTVDIAITDIDNWACCGSFTPEMGYMLTTSLDATCGNAGEVLSYACNDNDSVTKPDLTDTGVAVTGGVTYYLVVAQQGSSTNSRTGTFCVQISAPCNTVSTTSTPSSDCTAQTYTGRINFTTLGGAASYNLSDDAGNTFNGVSTSTDYDFNYTDLINHVVTVQGFDGLGDLVCTEEIELSSGCNGTEACDISGPDIRNTSYPLNMGGAVNEGTLNNPNCSGDFLRACDGGSNGSGPYSDYEDLWYVISNPCGADQIDITLNGLAGSEELIVILYGSCANDEVGSNPCTGFSSSTTTISYTGLSGYTNVYARVLPYIASASSCSGLPNPDGLTISAYVPVPNDICSNAADIEGLTVSGCQANLCQANVDTESTETCVGTSNCTPCGISSDANDLWYTVYNGQELNLTGVDFTASDQIDASVGDFDGFVVGDVIGISGTDFASNNGTYTVTGVLGSFRLNVTPSVVTQSSQDITIIKQDPSAALEVTVDFPNATDEVVLEFYSGCSTNSFEECATLSSTGANSSVVHEFTTTMTSSPIGSAANEYYVRAIPVAGNSVCDFSITGQMRAPNNSCAGSQDGSGAYQAANNTAPLDYTLATASGIDGIAGKDLWYNIDNSYNPSNYSINLSISDAGAWDGEVQFILYEYTQPGTIDCDNLVEYCRISNIDDFDFEDNGAGDGSDGINVFLGQDDYVLRIIETTADAEGDQLKVDMTGVLSTETIAANSDCTAALDISSGSQTGDLDNAGSSCGTFTDTNCTGGSYTTNTALEYEIGPGKDLWYQFTVPAANCAGSDPLVTSTVITGTTITITNFLTDSDINAGAYYELYQGDCNTRVECGNLSSGAPNALGESITDFTGLIQGETYYFRILRNANAVVPDKTFNVAATFTDVSPCNDDPANAEILTINNCLDYTSIDTWSAEGATATAPVSGAPESDVWFSFVAPGTSGDPSSANGGPYSTSKSWVTVFFESVSGEGLFLELYDTSTSQASGELHQASGAGDKAWASFGNLEPGEEYFIRLYHKQLATVDVQYKINITTGAAEEPGLGCGENAISNPPACSSGCGDLREEWFKIDLPPDAPANAYWMIEVVGYDQHLDFELRSKYLAGSVTYNGCSGTEGALEGSCADFDHPCSSVVFEAAVSNTLSTELITGADLTSGTTSCDDGATTPTGQGVRRIYFNMNGTLVGQKDYYFLRVFMDPGDPSYATATSINICQLNFYGPYSAENFADVGGTPDLSCASACAVSNVALNTDGACSGNNATFSIDFDITEGSGNYEIYATAANATYGISIGDVLGTLTGAATTATGLTITGTVTGPTTAAESISVDIRDTGDNTCNGGTPITVNIPICSLTCAANAGSLPTDPLGCQAVTNDIGGTTGLNVLSFDFNNATDYTQVYFVTDGTNVIEAISVTGTGVTPVAASSVLTNYTAGTYDVYVVNYNNTDAAASASIAGLTTVANIMAVATTYSSGACIVRAANAMTIEVCDPVCSCDSGTNGTAQGLTAVPGSYNTTTDYGQTYLLTNTASPALILDIQETANFTGLAAGTYQIYSLNYNNTAGQNPLVDNGADWTAITPNTTTIDDLSTTPGLADACFDLVAPTGTITINTCPTATIVSNNSPICTTENAEFVVNGTNGTTLTYTITGQTGNQTLALTGVDQTITAAGATADVILTFVSVADAGTPTCTTNLTNTSTVTVSSCITCVANPGSLPLNPLGCQEIADAVTGMTSIDLLSYNFNNTVGYTQAYFITDGTNILELVEVAGTGVMPAVVTSALATYTVGTYDVYVVNYDNTDGGANATSLAGLTTVAEITAVQTSYTSGACMVRTANAMTVEVCAAICGCDDGTPSGVIQGQTAVPGSYNSDYGQTYLLTDNAADPLILAIQDDANFTGLAAGTYKIYSLNYSTTAGESPLANGATWAAINPGVTTISDLSDTPGLADACFGLAGMTGTISVGSCPTANAITGNAMVCENTNDVAYSVTNNAGYTYAWSISGGGTLDATTGNSITVDWGAAGGPFTLTVIETETATGCSTTNTLDVTVNAATPTATVTSDVQICNEATDTGNDEGIADLDALVTAGDMTGTWTIVSGNTGVGTDAMIIVTGAEVEFDAGTQDGPFVVRYTLTGTAPCTDQTYDVTITRIECAACAPNVGTVRSN